jgi:Spy/CpxP family protein refolding chaperone
MQLPMTDYKATPEQWAQCEDWVKSSVVGASDACILELRARVETLEAAAQKHIIETNSNIVALFTRVESLEAAERKASKVHQISKPLKLTAKQQDQLNALLRPNSQSSPNPSPVGNSLMGQVETALMESVGRHSMARAAILAVAAWMTSNPDIYFPPALIFALEREVEL